MEKEPRGLDACLLAPLCDSTYAQADGHQVLPFLGHQEELLNQGEGKGTSL